MKTMPWNDLPAKEEMVSSSGSTSSNQSTRTRSTLPTEYSGKLQDSQQIADDISMDQKGVGLPRRHTDYGRRASVMTCDSSDQSDDDDTDIDVDNSFEVFHAPDADCIPGPMPSNPKDFAYFFPSSRRISIQHDDSTLDGNMNLRLDTLVDTTDGKKRPMTLFHLRMHDLKSRDFSLRRYCRDSGREVCKSERKYQQTSPETRPGLQRSLSSALATLTRQNSIGTPKSPMLARANSGFGSVRGGDMDFVNGKSGAKSPERPTNTIKLEFSNYAHVEVKRQGKRTSKRYGFFYWGSSYYWRRTVKQQGDFTEVSYHLIKDGNAIPAAHIVPNTLTKSQADEERVRGGWVPPCSLWIKDEQILRSHPDVADVVVATGLMALTDDCIKMTWPTKRHHPFIIPLLQTRFDLQYLGPRKLIDHVFNRRAQLQRPRRTPRRIVTS